MIIKLMLGVLQFKKKPFVEMQSLFEQLSSGQNPETLFITCADSRIIPSLITQACPGDLFVIRNIGNIIPPFPSLTSEAGGIEYALTAFNIKDIIICGHSQCGAMKGLLTPNIEKQLPSVASWLRYSDAVLKQMHEDHTEHLTDPNQKLSVTTQNNIVLQIEHLKTYPMIAQKLARNELTIHGWLYEFETGRISVYERTANKFLSLEDALERAVEVRKNKIIRNLAMDYLEGLTHPKSAKEYELLMRLFTNLKDNIAPIWEHIKDTAHRKMWAELGGLYESQRDRKFIELVESGSGMKLTDLKKFQKNISESEGYHKYCGQLLRTSFFSKPQRHSTIPTELYTVPSLYQ